MTDFQRCQQAATAPACPEKGKPSRRVAIHEAGHALALWWNGQPIQYVAAFSSAAPVLDGAQLVTGVVEAPTFTESAPADCAELPELVGRDLLAYIAGPAAEAKHRRYSLDWVLSASGRHDEQAAFDLLGLLPSTDVDEWRAPFEASVARCRVLVRRYWPAVLALADLLQARGHVEGEDVEALLCAVTGEAPKWRGNPLSDLDKRGARHA